MTLARGLPRVAGMATMPSRRATAQLAVASILPQVSELWLFLDRFDDIPPFARDPRIHILRSQDHGGLHANGKFLGLALNPAECVYFGVDDDIEYPTDYCGRLERYLHRYSGDVAVGVHASILTPPMGSYLRDRTVLHRQSRRRLPTEVDVLGTDSVAFLSSALRFDVRKWPHVNRVDLRFALEARKGGIPLISVPRTHSWLKCLEEAQPDSIYTSLLKSDTDQTTLASELVAAPRPPLPGYSGDLHAFFDAAQRLHARVRRAAGKK